MVSEKVTITNPAGFRLRPAGVLCESASQFACSVHFVYRGSSYNAKSVLSVLGSGVRYGDEIELLCSGDDEEKALAEIVRLVRRGFV